jgi:hypothetical protein
MTARPPAMIQLSTPISTAVDDLTQRLPHE